ncbi:MAG: glycosyltransferase family 2 protein [Nanoarchaeota archaeon]
MRAVVIIPCLNEEKTVGKVIANVRKVFKRLKIESIIISIDDASSDDSIKQMQGSNEIVNLKNKVKLAEVIRIGLKHAARYNPDIIVHIDADGQHNPEDLIKLVKPILRDKADFVIGSRFLKKNNMNIERKIGNVFFTSIVNLITGLKLTDTQSGFRVINYDCIKRIKLTSKYTYTQEEIIRTSNFGYRIKEVPINLRKRKYGKSKVITSPIKYGVLVLLDIVKIALTRLFN